MKIGFKMNVKQFSKKPLSHTAIAVASTMLFSNASAQFEAVECPNDGFSNSASLIWEDVWDDATNTTDRDLDRLGTAQSRPDEEFFLSTSGRTIFGVQIDSETPGDPNCGSSTVREVYPDGYYTGDEGPDPFGDLNPAPGSVFDGEPLTVRVDWPNGNCRTQIIINSYENDTGFNTQADIRANITDNSSLTPVKLERLEYTLFDVDIGFDQGGGLQSWDDVLVFEPDPDGQVDVPAGQTLTNNFTVSNNLGGPDNETFDSLSDNCNNTETVSANPPYFESCQMTVSWPGPLESFQFFYESGSQSIANPASQRIFLSNISFCEPVDPELLTTKVALPEPVRRDDELVYTLTVAHNNGSAASANNVVLSDVLPDGLTWLSTEYPAGQVCDADGATACNCSQPGGSGTVQCEIGELERGETESVIVTTRVE